MVSLLTISIVAIAVVQHHGSQIAVCEGCAANGPCLSLVPLPSWLIFPSSNLPLKEWPVVCDPENLGITKKQDLGNSRSEDFCSGKIIRNRYYILTDKYLLVWVIID